MTALVRRVQQVEEWLTPTESVVRWLTEAHAHGSRAGYGAWLREHPADHPFAVISRQVRQGVQQAHPGLSKRELPLQGDRTLQAGFLRIYLVEGLLQQARRQWDLYQRARTGEFWYRGAEHGGP